MPIPTIFLIDENGQLVEMSDQRYDSERLLQELLAAHPSVLAGDHTASGIPRKWLFVTRELGVPGEDGGSNRWSLDHLFIDQSGVPTLVEVKRSTDTRIRREVVGQMLDYAANAILYWPVEVIRQRFEETCRARGSEPDMVLLELIGSNTALDADIAVASFWQVVETNLRAGKIRLIFAADEIPPELRRVVEFLDEQMSPAEVLAIEIRQYVGTGVRTLVPSVIRSSKRVATDSGRSSIQWDRESFMGALRERRGPEIVAIATAILDWAGNSCALTWWGQGKRDGSRFIGISNNGISYYVLALWTYGRVELQFQWLRQRGVPAELLEAFASRLNRIAGIVISNDALTKRPAFDMALLRDPSALSQFFDAVEWFVRQIKSA